MADSEHIVLRGPVYVIDITVDSGAADAGPVP